MHPVPCGGLVDQRFFQVLLLLSVEVVVVFRNIGEGFSENLLASGPHFRFHIIRYRFV